jgi:hypothetical protein
LRKIIFFRKFFEKIVFEIWKIFFENQLKIKKKPLGKIKKNSSKTHKILESQPLPKRKNLTCLFNRPNYDFPLENLMSKKNLFFDNLSNRVCWEISSRFSKNNYLIKNSNLKKSSRKFRKILFSKFRTSPKNIQFLFRVLLSIIET